MEQLPKRHELPQLQFERYYGTREVIAKNNQVITLISEPAWGAFDNSLRAIEIPGSYILTPELITSSDMELDFSQANRNIIEERIVQQSIYYTLSRINTTSRNCDIRVRRKAS